MGGGRVKEKERNIDVREKHGSVASHPGPHWGLNLQTRHVPWLEIVPWPFALCDDAQPAEPHRSGLSEDLFCTTMHSLQRCGQLILQEVFTDHNIRLFIVPSAQLLE